MEQKIDNEMVPFVNDFVPYLDDDETEDGEVIEVNTGFKPQIISPTTRLFSGMKISAGIENEESEMKLYEPKGNLQSVGNLADYRCTADELRRHFRDVHC